MNTNILASSYIATGAAIAINKGMSPERFAERSAAYANKEASDQRLEALRATKPTKADLQTEADANSIALQNLLSEQQQTLRNNNKRISFDAFARMDQDDGNLEHFNQMLKDVVNSKIYGDITRVDKLIEEDRSMLREEGFPSHIIDQMINNKEYGKSHVRITKADGTKVYGEMDALKQIQGYNDYADATELARQKVSQEINTLAAFGYTGTDNNLEALRRTIAELPGVDINDQKFQDKLTENMQIMAKEGRADRRGSLRNATNEEGYAERALANEDIYPGDDNYNNRYNELVREYRNTIDPSKIKQLRAAEKAQDKLMKIPYFNKEEGNISRDSLSVREEMEIETQIRNLEALGDAKLDASTIKSLSQIRGFAHLGGRASNLTAKQTGLWDNFIFNMKKYFYDDVDGIDAAAAYTEYSNFSRHVIFGSVLPAAEIKSHMQSFGSLNYQLGPIFTHLKSSLEKVKNDYITLKGLNNRFVLQWRAGMTEEELDDTLSKIDQQLWEIEIVEKDLPFPVTPQSRGTAKTEATPEQQAILDEIYENRR